MKWPTPPINQSSLFYRKDLLRRYLVEILAFTYSVDLSASIPSLPKFTHKEETRLYTLSCAIGAAKIHTCFNEGWRIAPEHRQSIRNIIEACVTMHMPAALVLKHIAYYRLHLDNVAFRRRTSPYRNIAWFGRRSVRLSLQLEEDAKLVGLVWKRVADKTVENAVKEGIENMLVKHCGGKVWNERGCSRRIALRVFRYEALVNEIGMGFP